MTRANRPWNDLRNFRNDVGTTRRFVEGNDVVITAPIAASIVSRGTLHRFIIRASLGNNGKRVCVCAVKRLHVRVCVRNGKRKKELLSVSLDDTLYQSNYQSSIIYIYIQHD